MIEYRVGNATDAERVAQLHACSWRENYRGNFRDDFLDGEVFEERHQVWNERLRYPASNQLVLTAVDDCDLLGFICVYGGHDPEWGSFIDNLHVCDPERGRGIGGHLIERAGEWLTSSHPEKPVYLWVWEANVGARRFYERFGATNGGAFDLEVPGGGKSLNCRYVWRNPRQIARRSTLPLQRTSAREPYG